MKKVLSVVIAAGLCLSATAHAITVTNVQQFKTGTITSAGSHTASYKNTHHGEKVVNLNNDLGNSLTTYRGNEIGEINGQHRSSGTFSGNANYQVVGNTVVGNSTETQRVSGFDTVSVVADYMEKSNGVENTYSANGEVTDTRYFSNREFGSFDRFTRTNFTETTTSRSHFAE